MTTRKQAPAKAEATPAKAEDAPKRATLAAKTAFQAVLKALEGVDPKVGMSLKELEAATGHTYRQLHNVTWRMEGSPKQRDRGGSAVITKPDEAVIQRVGATSAVRYALGRNRTPARAAIYTLKPTGSV